MQKGYRPLHLALMDSMIWHRALTPSLLRLGRNSFPLISRLITTTHMKITFAQKASGIGFHSRGHGNYIPWKYWPINVKNRDTEARPSRRSSAAICKQMWRKHEKCKRSVSILREHNRVILLPPRHLADSFVVVFFFFVDWGIVFPFLLVCHFEKDK